MLTNELASLETRFEAVQKGEMAALNAELTKAKARPLVVAEVEDAPDMAGGDGDVRALAGWKFSLRAITPVKAAADERD